MAVSSYREFFEHSPDLNFIADSSGRFIALSRAWEAFLGWPRDTLVGQPIAELLHPEDATGEFFCSPVRIRSKDGTYRRIEWNASSDESGQTYGTARETGSPGRGEGLFVPGVGAWEADLISSRVSWSEETFRLLEVDSGQAPALDEAYEMYAPEARARVRNLVKELIETGKPLEFEAPVLTGKGRRIQVRVQAAVDRVDGKSVRVYGIFQDITEQNQIREENEHQRMLLQSIFDHLPLGLAVKDASRGFSYTFWNKGAEKIWGYTSDEVLGRTPYDVFSSEQADVILNHDRKAMARGTQLGIPEIQAFTKSGARVWTQMVKVPFSRKPEEKPRYLLVMGQDVTERKKTLEELQNTKNLLEDLADNAPAMIWMADETHIPIYYNRRWLDYTGLELEEARRLGWRHLVHPDDREQVDEHGRRARETLQPFELEYRLRAKDGSYRLFLGRGVPRRNGEGRFIGYLGFCLDITAWKSDQREKERLLEIVERTPDQVCFLDPRTNKLYMNQAAKEFFRKGNLPVPKDGHRFMEVAGIDSLRAYFTDWAGDTLVNEAVPTALREGVWRGESALWRIGRIDKREEVPVHLTLLAHRNGTGEVEWLSAVMRDISEQKAVEKSLRDSEELYRLVLRASNDGIWDWDLTTNTIKFSDRWKEMLGYAPDEIPDEYETFHRLIHPEDGKRLELLFRGHIQSGTPFFHTARYLHRDGTIRHILSKAITLRNEKGRPVRMVGNHTDVTELQKLYEELSSSSERLHIALRSSGFGTWDWDPQRDRLIWDEHMFELFGISGDSFTGRAQDCFNTIIPEDRARVEKDLYESMRARRPFTGEFRILRSGQIRIIRAESKTFYDSDGRAVRIIGVNWDVTERRAQEARLLHASKMSSLGEMASGVAHEINNPLTIITGRISQLREMAAAGPVDQETVLRITEKIESTSYRIAKIIQGLRAFSRNGEADPYLPASLKNIVDDTVELCSERFKHANIELRIRGEFGVELNCRSVQLSQVLLNLLNNAYDAVLEREEKWVELEGRVSDGMIEILITDSGPGIPEDVAKRIMEPFFTTKGVGKGTGLGLSISRGIAQEHRGDLALDGQCANTRFVLKLPLTDGLEVAAPPASPQSSVATSSSIVL